MSFSSKVWGWVFSLYMPGHLASGRGHLTEEVTSMERGGKIQKQTLFCSGNMYIWRQIIPFLQTNLCQGLTGIKFSYKHLYLSRTSRRSLWSPLGHKQHLKITFLLNVQRAEKYEKRHMCFCTQATSGPDVTHKDRPKSLWYEKRQMYI